MQPSPDGDAGKFASFRKGVIRKGGAFETSLPERIAFRAGWRGLNLWGNIFRGSFPRRLRRGLSFQQHCNTLRVRRAPKGRL